MPQRTNIQDVARRAAVSNTTVSFVLNGRTDRGIPEATRARVLRAARELGYRPNPVARSLVSGKTRTVGVVVPNLSANIIARLTSGIEDTCHQHDHRVLLAQAPGGTESEIRQAQLLLEHRVDGLICALTRAHADESREWLAHLAEEGVACVLVDERIDEAPVDYVVSDDRQGAIDLVAHLASLGHRRIAFLGIPEPRRIHLERSEGYRLGLTAAGLAPDPALTCEVLGASELVPGQVARLLGLAEPPTAVFATNDHFAVAVLHFAYRRGLRIPDDLALVGFGDIGAAAPLGLTTMRHPAREMGQQAAERLFARLANPLLPAAGVTLPTTLIVRETCGAAPAAPVESAA